MKIVYQKKDNWFIGHIQEYPDYESQGKTLDELKINLLDIYNDISNGLVPDAEPFQVLEVAIWSVKNFLNLFGLLGVSLFDMEETMTGIKIHVPA